MTEISDKTNKLAPAIERLVLHWGEMGEVWGVNRSVAQIHAALYLSEQPLTAEQLSELLSMARSNVSTSLRELIGWNLVRRVQVLGDRRDYYEAEGDLFEMVRRIAMGRKAREIDPAMAVLRECTREAKLDARVPAHARRKLAEMLAFVETVDKGFGEIMRLPSATVLAMIKAGGALGRLVSRKRS